jgi:two-component system sensor histidine kinase TtrS
LTGWIVHTVRVEHQVQRRTAELRDSLAARDQAEAKTRESQEQMEHLSRLSVLGELSGNLAHELNQPLTTIGTYARTVLRRQESGTLTAQAITEASTRLPERQSGLAASCSASVTLRASVSQPAKWLTWQGSPRRRGA